MMGRMGRVHRRFSETRAVEVTCARLSGERVCVSSALIDESRRHRLHLLVAESLSEDERDDSPAAGALFGELRMAAVVDAVRERELRRLLDVVGAAGIETLLLKGAGLAYTMYAAPHLRPRADVDLLIAPERVDDADRRLAAEGWTRAAEPDFVLGAAQRHYQRHAPGAPTE